MTAVPDYYISHAGIADNPGISQEALEALRRELKNNPSQLAAREHGLFVRPSGLVLSFDPEHHFEDITLDATKQLLKRSYVFGGMDFQLWRFAFTLWCADTAGVVHLCEEHFSQRERLERRATDIHNKLTALGISKRFPIFGDCANPTDIFEVNKVFKSINSPFRVTGVHPDRKIIKTGVTRMENLLARREPVALKVRRTLGEGSVWKAGYSASSDGTPVEGSRWVWEINNWQFSKTDDGKVQKDLPDDATADGADMMATTRYAIMSWWKAAGHRDDESIRVALTPAELAAEAERSARWLKRRKERARQAKRELDNHLGEYD